MRRVQSTTPDVAPPRRDASPTFFTQPSARCMRCYCPVQRLDEPGQTVHRRQVLRPPPYHRHIENRKIFNRFHFTAPSPFSSQNRPYLQTDYLDMQRNQNPGIHFVYKRKLNEITSLEKPPRITRPGTWNEGMRRLACFHSDPHRGGHRATTLCHRSSIHPEAIASNDGRRLHINH